MSSKDPHSHPHPHPNSAPDQPQPHRWCDVAVVGGSAAGLAASLMLARAKRSVIVVDAGQPRNAPADHMHGYLGREGISPADFLEIARSEVRSYGVEILSGSAESVTRSDGRFLVSTDDGRVISARRVVAATGLVDDLPDIPGLAEHWGGRVIHCPYCHGFEVRDSKVVLIVTTTIGLHVAGLFQQLTSDLTVVLHAGVDVANPDVAKLKRRGVTVLEAHVAKVGLADAADPESALDVTLADGAVLHADAVVVGARWKVNAEAFRPLGLEPTEHVLGIGDYIETTETGETNVSGVYAAGNLVDASAQVLHAAAAGSRVGAMINANLVHDDLDFGHVEPGEWDRRYRTDTQTWSGNPNGTLVSIVEALSVERLSVERMSVERMSVEQPAGGTSSKRALDIGAGEGGDAVWLARQGWSVCATDVSQAAIDRGAAAANELNLSIDWLVHDANVDALPDAAFDLVSMQYPAVRRSPDERAIHSILASVALGGTLVVVGHAIAGIGGSSFDPMAYVQPPDFAALVSSLPEWQIEVDEVRPRPGGHVHDGKPGGHVEDQVLVARRIA